MKCTICSKPVKENTDGNPRYCQGHDISEVTASKKSQPKPSVAPVPGKRKS